LPGVGRYSAAAIASIVFAVREPAIDGNVMRVVSRLLALKEDPKKRDGSRAIEVEARELLDSERPGDSNQAMMELGATVCRPRQPRCSICPLESDCLAAASGEPEQFPLAGRAAPALRRRRQVAVVENAGLLLLFRRPRESPRLAGLWELPWVDEGSEESSEEALRRRYGGRWEVGSPRGRVRHSVTNRSFQIEVVEAKLSSDKEVAEGPEAGWFSRAELSGVPVTGLVGKIVKLLDG